jgi:hypothetical protein
MNWGGGVGESTPKNKRCSTSNPPKNHPRTTIIITIIRGRREKSSPKNKFSTSNPQKKSFKNPTTTIMKGNKK